jgi:hypothetical protein
MSEPNDATGFTEEANQAVLDHDHLDWEDAGDREAAQKGWIPRSSETMKAGRSGTWGSGPSSKRTAPLQRSTRACGGRRG